MAKSLMRIAVVVIAAILGWTVGLRSVTLAKEAKDECHGPNAKACQVTVNVGGPLCPASNAWCDVTVGTTVLTIRRKDQGENVKMTWVMGSGDFKFADNGIEILGAPAGEFTDCRPEAGGRRFVCQNRHSAFGVFKYKVNVAGGVPPLDPFIVND